MENNDDEYDDEPIVIPPEYRGEIIKCVLRGVIQPRDFPTVFPLRKKIEVRVHWPDKHDDYFKKNDAGIWEHPRE